MGGKSSPGPTPEEREAQKLQTERLKREQEASERQKTEAEALMKARRKGGASGSLLTGGEEGTKGGYSSLLGG